MLAGMSLFAKVDPVYGGAKQFGQFTVKAGDARSEQFQPIIAADLPNRSTAIYARVDPETLEQHLGGAQLDALGYVAPEFDGFEGHDASTTNAGMPTYENVQPQGDARSFAARSLVSTPCVRYC